MKFLSSILPLLLLLTSCGSFNLSPDACKPQVRSAYDIGSGTTKLKVAKVNPCEGEIVDLLAQDQVKVSYRESLDQSPSNRFSEEVRKEGITALSDLQKISAKFKPAQERAVATAAFREASNGTEFIKDILNATNLNVEIISQEKEALLGYFAALTTTEKLPRNTTVWDIGGGSQQIVYGKQDDSPQIFVSPLGSVKFKNMLIEKIKKKKSSVLTPNPLSEKEIDEAIALAKKLTPDIPKALHENIQAESNLLIGIGGVHFHSIKGQVGDKKEITQKDIRETLKKKVGLTDKEIGGEYAATDISNLILVLATMEKMGATSIRPMDVNLTDALLIQ